MANKKISELDAVTDVQDADAFVLARSGASKKISGADMKAGIGGSSPVQVVGPFPVTYTDLTAFSVASGFVVTSFAAATIVLDVWLEPVTRWDNDDMRPQLSLYNGDLYPNSTDLYNSPVQLNLVIDTAYPSDFVNGPTQTDGTLSRIKPSTLVTASSFRQGSVRGAVILSPPSTLRRGLRRRVSSRCTP